MMSSIYEFQQVDPFHRDQKKEGSRFLLRVEKLNSAQQEQAFDWVTNLHEEHRDIFMRWKFLKSESPCKTFILETNSSSYILHICNSFYRTGLNPVISESSAIMNLRNSRVLFEEPEHQAKSWTPSEPAVNKSLTFLAPQCIASPSLPNMSIDNFGSRNAHQQGLFSKVSPPFELHLKPSSPVKIVTASTSQSINPSGFSTQKLCKLPFLLRNGRNILVELNHSPSNLNINVQKYESNEEATPMYPNSKYSQKIPSPEIQAALLGYLNLTGIDLPIGFDQLKNSKKKKASCVVYIKGFDQRETSLEQLTRVFQCFGEVENSLLHSKKEYALIKFKDLRGAKACIKDLYGKEIAGSKLLIHYSEFEDLTSRYFMNEKHYFQPNANLWQISGSQGCPSLSRQLIVRVYPLPGRHMPNLSPDDLQRAIQLPKHIASLKSFRGEKTEFFVECPSINSVIDFVKDYNYREFEPLGVFTVTYFINN